MWESLWKNDKQWKGSPNKTQSGPLGKVGLKYTVYKYSHMQSWLHEKECRKCDLCGEVYSDTGREFAEGLIFVVNYPLDTGTQYSRAAIDLNRFIDL